MPTEVSKKDDSDNDSKTSRSRSSSNSTRSSRRRSSSREKSPKNRKRKEIDKSSDDESRKASKSNSNQAKSNKICFITSFGQEADDENQNQNNAYAIKELNTSLTNLKDTRSNLKRLKQNFNRSISRSKSKSPELKMLT